MMLRSCLFIAAAFAAVAGSVGCGSQDKSVTREVKEGSDLAEAKQILKGYAEGTQMGSEEMRFPEVVENVRKSDPKKADVLEKGFADLKKTSAAQRPAKAKALLAKIEK